MRWQTTGQLLRDRPHVRIVPPPPGHKATGKTTPHALAPPPAPPALESLFRAIQDLAENHGWDNRYTYNAEGPDAGLHVMLVRDVVLCAEVVPTREALTPSQQTWLAALQATGQVEVYIWTPADLRQIQQRLRQKRAPALQRSRADEKEADS